jgi:hypothetical protein
MSGVEIGEVNIETRRHSFMVAFYIGDMLFRGNTFLFSLQHDGGAMRVIGAKIQAIVAAQVLKPYPYVCLDLLKHVAEVQITIGIGKGAGDEDFTSVS